ATIQVRADHLGIHFRPGDNAGELRIQQVDPAEMSPGQFAHLVRQAVEVRDARIIVIDSLNGYLNAMAQENYLTAQLHELLSYLARRGVTTLLVTAQHGVIGEDLSSQGIDA